MDKRTLACAAFAASFLAAFWRDGQAGAWLAVVAIAFTPLALAILAKRGARLAGLSASEAEALAWEGCAGGDRGPRGGVRAKRPNASRERASAAGRLALASA